MRAGSVKTCSTASMSWLWLPALRERPEDILILARHYLVIFGRKQRRHTLTFSPAAEQAMLAHVAGQPS